MPKDEYNRYQDHVDELIRNLSSNPDIAFIKGLMRFPNETITGRVNPTESSLITFSNGAQVDGHFDSDTTLTPHGGYNGVIEVATTNSGYKLPNIDPKNSDFDNQDILTARDSLAGLFYETDVIFLQDTPLIPDLFRALAAEGLATLAAIPHKQRAPKFEKKNENYRDFPPSGEIIIVNKAREAFSRAQLLDLQVIPHLQEEHGPVNSYTYNNASPLKELQRRFSVLAAVQSVAGPIGLGTFHHSHVSDEITRRKNIVGRTIKPLKKLVGPKAHYIIGADTNIYGLDTSRKSFGIPTQASLAFKSVVGIPSNQKQNLAELKRLRDYIESSKLGAIANFKDLQPTWTLARAAKYILDLIITDCEIRGVSYSQENIIGKRNDHIIVRSKLRI